MRALVFETRTGKPVMDVEVSSWSYDIGILAPDSLKLTIPAYTHRGLGVNFHQLLAPRKHGIALIDESIMGKRHVPAAGFISTVEADENADGLHSYSVSCVGVERLFEHRHVRKHPGWPLIKANGEPNNLFDVTLKNMEYGTIMKILLQEAMKWAGGELPIDFETDRAGARERSYLALDGKPVLEAIDDLTEVINGVEYDLIPAIDDYENVRFLFKTATDAERIIAPDTDTVINVGGNGTDVAGWDRSPITNNAATAAVFTGGKGSSDGDKVIAAYAVNPAATDSGLPYTEVWDSSHTSVSEQATLQKWAEGSLRPPAQQVGFSTKAENLPQLRHGYLVRLAVKDHWDVPNGFYTFRVLAIARSSSNPEWVDLKLIGE